MSEFEKWYGDRTLSIGTGPLPDAFKESAREGWNAAVRAVGDIVVNTIKNGEVSPTNIYQSAPQLLKRIDELYKAERPHFCPEFEELIADAADFDSDKLSAELARIEARSLGIVAVKMCSKVTRGNEGEVRPVVQLYAIDKENRRRAACSVIPRVFVHLTSHLQEKFPYELADKYSNDKFGGCRVTAYFDLSKDVIDVGLKVINTIERQVVAFNSLEKD